MTQAPIDSAEFIHGLEADSGRSPLGKIIHDTPNPDDVFAVISRLVAEGLDLNAAVPDAMSELPHEPDSAFLQAMRRMDPYLLGGVRYLGARPSPNDNVAGAVIHIKEGPMPLYGNPIPSYFVTSKGWMDSSFRQLDKAGYDFSAPIAGKPAAHAWVVAAVEAEGCCHEDSKAREKVRHALLHLGRAGVDFLETDAEGRSANDAAQEALLHPHQRQADHKRRSAFYARAIRDASQQAPSTRTERVQAAAQRQSERRAERLAAKTRAKASSATR